MNECIIDRLVTYLDVFLLMRSVSSYVHVYQSIRAVAGVKGSARACVPVCLSAPNRQHDVTSGQLMIKSENLCICMCVYVCAKSGEFQPHRHSWAR